MSREKQDQNRIDRSISRMPCGKGLFFVEDTPFFKGAFPITSKNDPQLISALILLRLSYDQDGCKDWNITYYHTSYLKGMVKQREYELPAINLGNLANHSSQVSALKTPSKCSNAFQAMVMGDSDILGYPLTGNYLDYLSEAINNCELYLDDLVAGVGLQLRDYTKTASLHDIDLSEDRVYQICDFADELNISEPYDFHLDICVPKGLLNANETEYCVMPKANASNPFNNMEEDYYLDCIPPHIQKTMLEAIKEARDKYGLGLECYHQQVETDLKKLMAKYARKTPHKKSNLLRHKNAI